MGETKLAFVHLATPLERNFFPIWLS
jgi:hypothetical protein